MKFSILILAVLAVIGAAVKSGDDYVYDWNKKGGDSDESSSSVEIVGYGAKGSVIHLGKLQFFFCLLYILHGDGLKCLFF